jgi:hypothetical protein
MINGILGHRQLLISKTDSTILRLAYAVYTSITVQYGRQPTYNQLCGAFALCLYLLGYPMSLTTLHSKTVLLWRYDFVSNSQIYFGPHVKFPILLADFKQILSKVSSKSFHVNPSSGYRPDTWRTNGRTRSFQRLCDSVHYNNTTLNLDSITKKDTHKILYLPKKDSSSCSCLIQQSLCADNNEILSIYDYYT